jgi:hypothetical protein
MLQHSTHDAKASMSRTASPAADVAVSQLERGLRHPGVPHAPLDEAQVEQVLW